MSVSNILTSTTDARAPQNFRDLTPSPRGGPEWGHAQQTDSAEGRQKALNVVQQALTRGYEALASRHTSPAERFARVEPLTPERVAGTILGFIEQRLRREAAEGASTEQLQRRLEQGLAGFKKGFAEAREQLKALSRLTPAIETDIAATREKVLSGVEGLRQRIMEGAFSGDEPSGSREPRASLAAYRYEQARASSFSFQLTTSEGDRVTIEARSSAAVTASGDARGSSLSASGSRSVAWQVQGDLNEEERTAIASLLGGVDRLAEQFFAGDLEGAVASAMDLGYDREQVARFSLKLVRSDISRVSESYGRVGEAGASPVSGPSLQERLEPVGLFLRALESVLTRAGQISPAPWEPILAAGERMAAGERGQHVEQAQSLRAFMADMLETLTTAPHQDLADVDEAEARPDGRHSDDEV